MLNSSSNLYKKEWLNLVFKNRNQSYGAYELRLHSDQTTLRALFIAAPLFILLFASPRIYKAFLPDVISDTITASELPIVEANIAPPKEQPKPLEKPQPKPEPLPAPTNIKTAAVPSHPVVVSTPVDIEPPTLDQVENAAIGPVTKDGEATNLASVPAEGTGGGAGKGTAAGTGTEDTNIYNAELIEAYPEFEGGMKGWAKYLQRNLHYPSDAAETGLQGKVFISFVVEKDGSISNVALIKGVHGSMDQEAMRVIKKSPKWKPGIQNRQNVRVRYTMPISFALTQ